MNRRQGADRCAGHVQGHADPVFLGQIADSFGLQNAAAGGQIGVAHADGARVEQRLEAVVQVDVLAGATRCAQFAAQARPLLSELPGNHVLEPGEIEALQGVTKAQAILDPDVAEMIGRDGDFVARDVAHGGDVVGQDPDALVRQSDVGEGVHDAAGVQHPARGGQGARHADQVVDADIHLEHREAARHALFEFVAHGFAGGFIGRVAIHPNGVAVLAARQHIRRHAIRLAGQIHERHLHRAYAAGLARMPAKLLDLAKDPFNVARVLACDPRLQHQGEGLAGPVAHLADAGESLIRVDPDEREAPTPPADRHGAQVGDAQFARARVGANVVFWSWLFHEAILRIFGEVTLPARSAGRVTSPIIFRGDR